MYTVRPVNENEYEEVFRLIWLTFIKHELKSYTEEQAEVFRISVEPISLAVNSYDGRMTLLGAYSSKDGELMAVGGIKLKTYPDEKKDFVNDFDHITLLFTKSAYHRLGIGRDLTERMISIAQSRAEARGEKPLITVNSSDNALGFYIKMGFVPTGERVNDTSGVYTPMRLV